MITKVVHGWRPAGLLAYLLGPGTAEVHRAPRVIASWDGLDTGWQPASTGPGEYDLALGPLITALHAPVVAAGLPTRTPPGQGKRGYVWHCSARVAATDRVLSDGEWAGIARELLDGAGIAVRGDSGGPRWVAIRHAEDHIHIAAVLVRQDTSRRFWPHHDYPKLRAAARRIEQRLGLTVTAAPDGTAAATPSRGEVEKAGRQGRVPARVELRRAAQQAAVAASDVDEFVAHLRERGYRVGLRRAPSGDLLGYKLARPGDVTAAGKPVFYSGSKLAPDLSLPRLQQRWASTPNRQTAGGNARGPGASEVLEAVAAARAALRTGSENGDGIGAATADLLTALADPTRAGRGNGGERRRTGSTGPPAHLADTRRSRVRWRGAAGAGPQPTDRPGSGRARRGRRGGVGGRCGRAGGRDRRLAGRPRPRPAGRRSPPQRSGRHRARPRPPARRTAQPDAERVGGTAGHGARHGREQGRGGPAAGRTASPP